MHIIFNDEDYYDELIRDIGEWCDEHDIPHNKIVISMKEDNVDNITYFVITVNEPLFSYLMFRELDMTEKYGREGWNRYIESNYNCETA